MDMCGKNGGHLKTKWRLVLSKWPHLMPKKKFFLEFKGK